MPDCAHMNFSATMNVVRLTQTDGQVDAYCAEIRVRCVDCNKPFQFLGLKPGFDTQGARVSIDGLEANLAIVPQGEQPNPFQRILYNIGSFDG